MLKALTGLKAQAAYLLEVAAARLAVRLGNVRVASLEIENGVLREELALADRVADLQQQTIRTMTAGYGLLGEAQEAEHRRGLVTIACLLMAQGGTVAVGDDVYKAIVEGDFKVDYAKDGDKTVVSLTAVDPAEGEEAEPQFIDDLDGEGADCACDDAACVACDCDPTPAAAA